MRPFASVLVLAFLIGTAASARAECPPTAVPIGEPALVQTLSDRLVASGITTTQTADCPAVRVTVEQRGPQLHLRVVDAYQRLGERDVRDLATAAAIIESWTLQEIEQGTLPEPTPAVTAVAPLADTRYSLSASGRTAIGDDSSTWLGGAIQGCLRVRWSCLGASASVASDTSAVDDVSTGTHHSLAIDTMATADAPRRIGGFVASPGVMLGYGWSRIEQQHLDVHSMPFAASHTDHALRAGARVVLSHRLAGSLAVFGELFADVATLRTTTPDGPRARTGVALGVRVGAP